MGDHTEIENEIEEVVLEQEEQLDEISKERVGKYAIKALASREKARTTYNGSQGAASKTAAIAARVKKAGPDKDYGETEENHAGRVKNTEKRAASAKKVVDDADKTYKKRNVGLHLAGQKLAKEEVEEMTDEVIEEGTAAEASLHPAAKSISDPKSKLGMISSVMSAMHLTPTTELTKWYEAAMAQFGPGKTYGVGDNSAKNSASIDTTLGKGPKTKDAMPKLSVKEDMDAIFSGEELTEEFKENVATLFEAAINAQVTARIVELEEEYQTALEEEVEEIATELEAKVDAYINSTVEEFMEENQVAVESALRNELMEEFMEGLKNLFAEHYINVPNDKVDVLEALAEKVNALEAKLDEAIVENSELKKALVEEEAASVFEEFSEGLALTQKERFAALAEGIEFNGDIEKFKSKLSLIKETYFGNLNESASAGTNIEEEYFEEEVTKTVNVDPSVNRYVQALSKTVKTR